MEVTFQPVLDKNYRKMQRIVSRKIYRRNKFRRLMMIGDVLMYVIFLLPSCYIAFEVMNWAESFYDCYDNMLAYWAGDILLWISGLMFFYGIGIRPYLNCLAFQSQVYGEIEQSRRTLRIRADGLYADTNICQTLYYYSQIRHLENINGYLVILINSGLYLFVPHDAFTNEEQRRAFETTLRKKIAENSTALSGGAS